MFGKLFTALALATLAGAPQALAAGPVTGALGVQNSNRLVQGHREAQVWTVWYRDGTSGPWTLEDSYSTAAVAHQHANDLSKKQHKQVHVQNPGEPPPKP